MADNQTTFILNARDNTGAALSGLQARLSGLNAAASNLHTSFMRPLKLAGIDNVTGALSNLKSTMASMPIAGTLLAAGGVAAATKGLLGNSVAAHKALGAIQDLSSKYKVSTDALQVFGEMGADVGVGTESIAKGFGKLQLKVAEAMQGSKESVQAFQDVGLTPKDLEGGAVEVFKKIADVYKSKDFEGADPFKVASAKALLGKAGMEIIPILEQGGAKYDEILKRMQAEGRFFTSDVINEADKVGDAWDASMRRIAGLKQVVGLAMAPMLDAVTTSIAKLLDSPARGEIIETFKKLGETIASEAPKFIEKLPSIINGFNMVFSGIKRIADLVGWDTIVSKVIFMLASPFIAATISATASLWKLTVATTAFIGRMAILAGGAIMTAVRSLIGLQVAFTQVGLSATVAWLAALAPVSLIVAGIAALGAAVYLVYKNLDGFAAFFSGVWEGISAGFTDVKFAFEPMISLFTDGIGWIKELTGVSDDAESSFSSWTNAGRFLGEVLSFSFRLPLTAITLLIDAVRLLGATIDFVQGKGFNFESSTSKLWGDRSLNSAEVNQENFKLNRQAPSLNLDQGVTPARAQFDGKLNININSEGKATVQQVDASQGFDITARAGAMVGA